MHEMAEEMEVKNLFHSLSFGKDVYSTASYCGKTNRYTNACEKYGSDYVNFGEDTTTNVPPRWLQL